MSFFNKLFKKQRQPKGSTSQEVASNSSSSKKYTYVKSKKNFTVRINTDKELSEEQQSTIFSTVKNGVSHNEIPSKICVNIMLETGIMYPVTLNITPEGALVTF